MDPRRDRMSQRNYHKVTVDNICPSMIRGVDFIRDPRINKDRNERLFYRLIAENVEQMMHLVCILGLGDLGSYGMGIPVGKQALHTDLAGIKPHHCFPTLLAVGTNTQSLLDDPYYIGLRHKRVQGPEYDEFLDEFMQAVVRRYGQNTLIQFEDFANHNAFRLLAKYRDRYCSFNDDIQGTAAVTVAGILAFLRIRKSKLSDHRFLFLGAGEAALGIPMLMTQAMVNWSDVHSNGLLVKTRSKDVLAQKQILTKDLPHLSSFAQMIEAVKSTVILGAAAARGAFNTGIIKRMAELNQRPILGTKFQLMWIALLFVFVLFSAAEGLRCFECEDCQIPDPKFVTDCGTGLDRCYYAENSEHTIIIRHSSHKSEENAATHSCKPSGIKQCFCQTDLCNGCTSCIPLPVVLAFGLAVVFLQ